MMICENWSLLWRTAAHIRLRRVSLTTTLVPLGHWSPRAIGSVSYRQWLTIPRKMNHLPHINSRVSPNPRLHRTSPTPHSNRMAPKDKAPTQNPRPHRQSPSHHPYHADPKDNVPTVTVVGSSIVRGVAPLVNGREFDAVGLCCPGR